VADDDRRLVYSTDGSLPLPRFDKPAKGRPAGRTAPVPDDGVVRVGCEKRRGGSMTLVYGLAAGELEPAGRELRRLCGSGGTSKDGIVAIQGDHRDAIVAYFTRHGRKTKRMGGG
jgi:translation initiation factor 1